MQTLEIKVPESKTQAVKDFLKEMGVTVKVKKEGIQVTVSVKKRKSTPNSDTIAAMNELKAGKGKKFNSVDELFSSI